MGGPLVIVKIGIAESFLDGDDDDDDDDDDGTLCVRAGGRHRHGWNHVWGKGSCVK